MAGNSRLRKLIIVAVIGAVCLIGVQLLLNQQNKAKIGPLLHEARAAMERSDWESAGKALDQILSQDPMHSAALFERGKLWALIGQYDNALTDWGNVHPGEAATGSETLASQARYLMGALHLENKRARLAEKHMRSACELSDKNLQAAEHLLRLFVLQMRADETRELLAHIEAIRPLSLEEMVLRLDAGLPIIEEVSAVPQLQSFIKSDPQDIHSVTALCRYLLASDRLDKMEAVFGGLPTSILRQSDIVAMQVMLATKQGKFALASQHLKQRPEGELTYLWWLAAGEFAHSQDQNREAANCFMMATQLQPEVGATHYKYGIVLEVSGKKEQAEQELKLAAALDKLHQYSSVVPRMMQMATSERVQGLLRIAHSLRQLDRPREVLPWVSLALQLQPENSEALDLQRQASQAVGSATDIASQTTSDKSLANSPTKSLPKSPALLAQNESLLAEYLNWINVRSAGTSEPTSAGSMPDKQAYDLRLVDIHETAQLDFQYFNGNSGSKYLIESMGGGIGVIDFDNDGWPDCYFPQGSRIPNDPSDFTYLDQLYRNVDGQRFANVTAGCRIVENGYSQGAAVGDINNDGFSDVVVANYGRSRVFVNQGDGTFLDATEAWGLDSKEMSSSVALSDLDLDGALDLYIVNYVDALRVCRDTRGEISTCNPQNFAGVQDRLYRNSGDGHWMDVTSSSGVVADDGKGLGVVATDLDDDGLVDLYISNDSTPNFLFKNLGNMQFAEIGLVSGTALSVDGQAQAGMGIAAADFNGDLLTDLVVTNFYSEACNLYINHGEMNFTDNALPSRLKQATKEFLGFGAQGEDFDLDGNVDLIMANGHIDDFSYRGERWKMPTLLFRNRGQAIFDSCGQYSSGYFDEACLGRGVASLDWNRDGKKDIVVVHQDRQVALLENRTQTNHRSLQVKLIGTKCNRDAIGAAVTVTGKQSQRRSLNGGAGFYSTSENELIFGLGNGNEGTMVEIRWPGGRKDTLEVRNVSQPLVVVQTE